MSAEPDTSDWDPFLGRTALVPAERLGEVKANLFMSRKRYVEGRWGERGLKTLYENVRPDIAEHLQKPKPLSSWMPYAEMLDVDRVIATELMTDIAEMRAFGADIANYDLVKVYSHILRMVTGLAFMVRRANILWALYFRNDSKLVGDATDGHGTIKIQNQPLPRYMCRFGITGWFDAMMAFYGVQGGAIDHHRCQHDGDVECEWSLTWRPQKS